MNKTYLFIIISSLALCIVLIIQVNWILKTAKIKEELFNEKANMVLLRTNEALSDDTETCQKIGASIDYTGHLISSSKLGKADVQKIDSIFIYYMNLYNFHIDYSFVVTKQALFSTSDIYTNDQALGGFLNQYKIELKLIFPKKRQFIIAEMGPMFISSVCLILVVLFMFWRTTLSLLKEKRISTHSADFLNNMTHEFKTPLTNIALATKMIKKNTEKGSIEKIDKYSDIILSENKKLSLQVEQVLGMTALERGEIPLKMTRLDLDEILVDVINCFSLQLEKVDGHISYQQDANNLMLMADKTHLTNAFCNLVDNAIKYSKTKVDISIHSFNLDNNLVIAISDKGMGIEKEFQRYVFDKFFRVPTGDIHDIKGFGLGLPYVKKIIALHGGKIQIQSEKGKGTTFTITLAYD